MLGRIALIARVELVSVSRLRWIRLFAVAFALVSIGAAWSAGAARELGGVDGFARTTVPLVRLLVALVGMLLGVSGQTSEPGCDAFLHTQPVSRFEVLLGRWAGEGIALGTALAAGLGVGGGAVALGAGVADAARFLVFS